MRPGTQATNCYILCNSSQLVLCYPLTLGAGKPSVNQLRMILYEKVYFTLNKKLYPSSALTSRVAWRET